MMRRLIVAAAVLVVGFASLAKAGDVAKGKALFSGGTTPKCTVCHTDVKNPLAKTGAENTADELKAWLRTPKEQIAKKGKKGLMPAYGPDKVSDADLDHLVAYLATLK
jgi:mono/diheme cytochrome c family protein